MRLAQLLRPGSPLTGAGSRSTQAAVSGWSSTHWAIWSLRAHHTSGVLAQPGEDPVQHPDPGGVPGDAFVQADDHHPAAGRALGVELVEFVNELLLVGGRVEAGEAEAGDVVEMDRVRDGRERQPVDQLQERLVGGQVVDVVGEPELGQDLQGVHAGPDPVVVVPGGAGAGGLLDRLHAVRDPFGFLRAGQVVLPLPAPAVGAGLVAAADDLGGDLRVPADRVADHEGGHLDAVCLSIRSRMRGTPSRAPYS